MAVVSLPMYESGSLARVTGGALRPGGLELTQKMLSLCNLPIRARILDVGCGSGSTVQFLLQSGFTAMGVDRSKLLLRKGIEQFPDVRLLCALGQSLPFASAQMDAVLAECSFSAMSGEKGVLAEIWRILRPAGWLALSDVYAREPGGISALRSLPLSCGLPWARTKEDLYSCLQSQGFETFLWEDHSEALKYLAAQMILSHGSMGEFWRCSEPAVDSGDIQSAIKKAKLGYYVLLARKNQEYHEPFFQEVSELTPA